MTTTVCEAGPVSTAELRMLVAAAARATEANVRCPATSRRAADRAVTAWLLPTAVAVAAYDVVALLQGLA